ncbi:MAG: DHH family phosphoesterase [Planctomycetota bacterium]
MTRPLSPVTEAQRRALDIFRNGRRFVLVGHVRPDGDCIGSQVALARVLAALGKDVVVVNPDAPPPVYAFLYEDAPFARRQGITLPPHDVCVLLDINEIARCGDLDGPIREAPAAKVVVDHHPFLGEPWWDAAFTDRGAAATGLLVHRISRHLGVRLDLPTAEAIFTALVTDTGWFRYSNTDAEAMALASELVESGVVPNDLYMRIYQQQSPEHPRAVASVVQRLEYFCGNRLVVVDQPLLPPGEHVLEDNDPVLDLLRSVGDVEAVLYVREMEGGRCKLSARSKATFDVGVLARRFGGGGHAKAAGATIEGPLAEVKARLTRAATELLIERRPARRAGSA